MICKYIYLLFYFHFVSILCSDETISYNSLKRGVYRKRNVPKLCDGLFDDSFITMLHHRRRELEKSISEINMKLGRKRKPLSATHYSYDVIDPLPIPSFLKKNRKRTVNRKSKVSSKKSITKKAYSEPRARVVPSRRCKSTLNSVELPYDISICSRVLDEILNHRYAKLFLELANGDKLANTVELDLENIKENLQNLVYLNPQEFINDVDFIFNNVLTCFPPTI